MPASAATLSVSFGTWTTVTTIVDTSSFTVRWTESGARVGRTVTEQYAAARNGTCAGLSWKTAWTVSHVSPFPIVRFTAGLCYRWVVTLIPASGSSVSAASPPVRIVHATVASLYRNGSRSWKVIALTFDDGWNTANCQKIVDVLTARKVPATFFPVGVNVASSPAFWRAVAARGFPIGNHTQNHLIPFTGYSYATELAEFVNDRSTVDRIIGRPTIDVARAPGGDVNYNVQLAAGRAGYAKLVNWDVSFADTSYNKETGQYWSVQAYINAAERGGQNGSIILGHCGPPVTPLALPAVIDYYRARGFTFVTIPQLLGVPGPYPTFK